MSTDECTHDFHFRITNRKGETFDCVVDAADQELVESRRWRVFKGRHTHYLRSGALFMHRAIAQAKPGIFVDHEDGNGLNNRRNNLREATRAENAQNTGPYRTANRKSKYKGVSFCSIQTRPDRLWERWSCTVNHGGKQVLQTYHADEIEAALAYDAAVRRLKGPKAWTNFPLTGSVEIAIGIPTIPTDGVKNVAHGIENSEKSSTFLKSVRTFNPCVLGSIPSAFIVDASADSDSSS